MESQSRIALLHQLYQASIAGAFPVPDGGNPHSIARMEAEEALDTPRVHMLLSVRDGFAYYIATASRELASLPGFATPLAAALPNHHAHVGDAAYRVTFGEFATAVIRRGESLRLIVGYKHEVAASISPDGEEAVPIVDCDESSAVRLESEAWIYRSLADKVSRLTGHFAMGLLSIALITGVVANGITGFYGGGSNRSAARLAAEAESAIRKAQLSQPLGDQLVRVIELSKATVETGGWIDAYLYTKSAGESFTISLPGWVTSAAIAKLASGITTHKQPNEVNLIWARKADKAGNYPAGPGPVEIVDESASKSSRSTSKKPSTK